MKVLLYFENEKMLRKSGIGRAFLHQSTALILNGVEYTLDRYDNYDVAHVNTYFKKSYKLIKYCKKHNIKVIVHGHSTKEDFCNSFRMWRILKPFVYHWLKKTYSSADYIITPTPYSKKLIENYDFVTCPVINLSNGIDLKKYSDYKLTEDDIITIKEKFNLNNEKVVIGIGWFFQRKGINDFIEVAKSHPDIKFIWFGNLNKLLNTSNVNKAIKNKTDNVILPGYVEQSFIIKMLHYADIFFFPTYEETEGIVLLEALACRCNVLVRDIEVFNYLDDGINCFKGKDNNDFSKKISYILNNDTTKVKDEGFKIASDRDLKKIGKKLKEIYEGTIKA